MYSLVRVTCVCVLQVWCVAVSIMSRKFRRRPHIFTINLFVAQVRQYIYSDLLTCIVKQNRIEMICCEISTFERKSTLKPTTVMLSITISIIWKGKILHFSAFLDKNIKQTFLTIFSVNILLTVQIYLANKYRNWAVNISIILKQNCRQYTGIHKSHQIRKALSSRQCWLFSLTLKCNYEELSSCWSNSEPTLLQKEIRGRRSGKMVSSLIRTMRQHTQRSQWSRFWPQNTSQSLTTLPICLIYHYATFFFSLKINSSTQGNSFWVWSRSEEENDATNAINTQCTALISKQTKLQWFLVTEGKYIKG